MKKNIMIQNKNIKINPNISIKETMKILSVTIEKCLIVVDKRNKLLGTITDGDLRRGLLKNKKINDSINYLYNKKPYFLLENKKIEEKKIKKIFIEKKLSVIPIVNNRKVVIDYLTLGKIENINIKNKKIPKIDIVIMAGGKGTRLDPFTLILPKPLIPIKEKPIIIHILEKFYAQGSKNFYLSVNYKKNIIKSYLDTVSNKYNLNFIEEKKPLGTAGSLYFMKKLIKNNFILTNCDTLIDLNINDLFDYHVKSKNLVTLIVAKTNYKFKYGSCIMDENGFLKTIEEKPKLSFFANTGMYIMSKKIFDYIPKNKKYDATDLINDLKNDNKNIGLYVIDEKKWIDIGDWSEYKKVKTAFEI